MAIFKRLVRSPSFRTTPRRLVSIVAEAPFRTPYSRLAMRLVAASPSSPASLPLLRAGPGRLSRSSFWPFVRSFGYMANVYIHTVNRWRYVAIESLAGSQQFQSWVFRIRQQNPIKTLK